MQQYNSTRKGLVHQTAFKYPFVFLASITSEKIYERNSKLKLKPMKQKIPINYFYVNLIIGVFVIITSTALILFVIHILKWQI